MKFSGDLHLRNLPFTQDGKLVKVSIVVQEQLQLDRPHGPSEMSPVKDAEAQADGGRIEADQFVLELEFLRSPYDGKKANGYWQKCA